MSGYLAYKLIGDTKDGLQYISTLFSLDIYCLSRSKIEHSLLRHSSLGKQTYFYLFLPVSSPFTLYTKWQCNSFCDIILFPNYLLRAKEHPKFDFLSFISPIPFLKFLLSPTRFIPGSFSRRLPLQ